MKAPTPALTLGVLREGIDALVAIGHSIDGSGWHRTVATDWSAVELARHVLAVSRWYHSWLDAAVAGSAAAPFPADELDDRNELMIHELRAMSGEDAIDAFAESAHAYADRLEGDPAIWELPYNSAVGRSTTGEHAGLAAAEWHLHAWDLSKGQHVPADPARLFTVTAYGFAALEGPGASRMIRLMTPLGARMKPWPTMLQRSGR